MVSAQSVCELFKNMAFTIPIWYLNGGLCCDKNYTTGVTAWLLITACIFWLSHRNFTPEFLDVCDGVRPLFNVLVVSFWTYLAVCYLWVGFLSALSMVFCYIDRTARKAGFPVLTDNMLFTLKPNSGYFNLFEVMAFSLLVVAVGAWFNSEEECDDEDE